MYPHDFQQGMHQRTSTLHKRGYQVGIAQTGRVSAIKEPHVTDIGRATVPLGPALGLWCQNLTVQLLRRTRGWRQRVTDRNPLRPGVQPHSGEGLRTSSSTWPDDPARCRNVSPYCVSLCRRGHGKSQQADRHSVCGLSSFHGDPRRPWHARYGSAL
jgi:hypothetical protein